MKGTGLWNLHTFRFYKLPASVEKIFSCKNIRKITLSEEAVMNGACLKEEFHKLSEIKSATASHLTTDYQKHRVGLSSWWVQWGTGRGVVT